MTYIRIQDAFFDVIGIIDKEVVRLSLALSPKLNERLEQLASSGCTTKTEILCKAIALCDLVAEVKTEKWHRLYLFPNIL